VIFGSSVSGLQRLTMRAPGAAAPGA